MDWKVIKNGSECTSWLATLAQSFKEEITQRFSIQI
jgi:hypothetical protein